MFSAIPIPIPYCGCTSSCTTTPSSTGAIEVLNVDLVADMAATTPYSGLKQFNVSGWTSVGDGLGGIWIYQPSSTATADGYYVIETNTGVGRYVKLV